MSTDPDRAEHEVDQIAELLRCAAPVPSSSFVDSTERRLLGRVRRHPSRARTGSLALAMSVVIGGLIYLGGATGAGPLGGHDDRADAEGNCDVRTVERTVPLGRLELRDGRPVVVPETRVRPRQVSTGCP